MTFITPAPTYRLPRAAVLILAVALGLGGCCPDPVSAGDGAASTGGDGAAAAGSARLSTIQKELFNRHCVTDCHQNNNAAAGLTLATGRSYQALINQASQQITSQLRVSPGNAEASYLIKKLEGDADIVGVQMPRLAPPRPQAEIDRVRAWITRGAPND